MPIERQWYEPASDRRRLRAVQVQILRETDGAFHAKPNGCDRVIVFPKSVVDVRLRASMSAVLMIPEKLCVSEGIPFQEVQK